MTRTAHTVTEWARGNRPSVMITVEADRHGRTAAAIVAVQFLAWGLPAITACAWISGLLTTNVHLSGLLTADAVAAVMFTILSRVIHVGAPETEPESADLPV